MKSNHKLRRDALNVLVGVGLYLPKKRSICEEAIIKRAGGLRTEYFKRVPEVGVRAWLVQGKKKDLLVWDNGNGWYQVISESKNE